VSTKRGGTQPPSRPTVTVRVWNGQEWVEFEAPGPLAVYGKASKRSS
jgi:hypothetical protein